MAIVRRIMQMQNAQVRERDGKRYLEGYFAVFGKTYKVWDGWVETVSNGAFARWLAGGGDTKVLWNHNHDIVLGSTANGTATLREDETGLWGSVLINEKDQDAVNLYERVKRGDVSQCSFGFDILQEMREIREDGIVVYHLQRVKLWEVSVCTFPAYEETGVQARKADEETLRKRALDEWRARMTARLKNAAGGETPAKGE